MSKRYRRRHSKSGRTDAIIIVSILVFATAYNRGVSATDLVNLTMAILLVAAIVFAIAHFAIKDWREFRNLLRDRRIRKAFRNTNIDSMSGREFERYIAMLLKSRGCTRVELTPYYDWGIDIIARKNGVTWGVQVKHHSRPVGISAVREVVAALKEYNCDRAMVICNNTFSRPAKELAKSNNCILVSGDVLAEWVQESKLARHQP